MQNITVDEFADLCRQHNGLIDFGTFHWSAGRYRQFFGNEYPIEIDYDGKVYISSDNLLYKANGEKFQHCWRRNTGNVGIGCCAAYDAHSPQEMGDYPVTDKQIESMAKVAAILNQCANVDIDAMKTHAEWANVDGYGPCGNTPRSDGSIEYWDGTVERWDLWLLEDYDGTWLNGGDIIRGKARWFLENGVSEF